MLRQKNRGSDYVKSWTTMWTTLGTSGLDVKTTPETIGLDVKTTLETIGLDVKTTPEMSGLDVKTTLETRGLDAKTHSENLQSEIVKTIHKSESAFILIEQIVVDFRITSE